MMYCAGFLDSFYFLFRVQPVIKDESLRRRNEQKMAAALALYHFYKPRSKEGKIISLKEFTKVFISQKEISQKNNTHFLNLTVPMKKLTSHQLKKCHDKSPNTKPVNHLKVITSTITTETVKTSYGRVSKPVLAPIKTENVQCEKCKEIFNSLTILKSHMKKVHDFVENEENDAEKLLNSKSPQIPSVSPSMLFKCDICYRRFEKRSRMIRHIKNVHSTDIHRVDLSTFVMPKKFQQAWTFFELS